MAQTMANFAAMLKEYYSPDRVAKMILEDSPFLAMVPKKAIVGESWDLPIIYAGTAGRSAAFATAQAQKTQTSSVKFQITTSPDYSLASLNRRVMLASRSNAGAFLPAAKAVVDDALMQLRRSLAITSFRDGTGVKGQVAASTATTLTLSNREDAVNFQVGERVTVTDDTVPTTVRGTAAITGINRSTGVLTFAAIPAGSVANDVISTESDLNAVQSGLGAWLPDAAPGAAAFFGVDRTTDSDMLGGVRFDGTGMLRYEALIDGQSEIGMIGGGRPTHAFCNPVDFRAVIKELEAQVTRPRMVYKDMPVRKGSKAMVGFQGVEIQGDSGVIELFSDRFCPPNKAYVLQLDEWRLAHIGNELVDIVGRDSDEGMLVESATDGYEIRAVSYPQLATGAPGHSGVVHNWGL